MDLYTGDINQLITELGALPGIGSKTAERMAFHIINLPADRVKRLSDSIVAAKEKARYCSECCTLTDAEYCPICANPKRDHKMIMVVENPRDLAAYERPGNMVVYIMYFTVPYHP